MITSQIDTAPKQLDLQLLNLAGLITSQIDTAPKREVRLPPAVDGLITSQIDTAPKQTGVGVISQVGLITSQIDTAPKPAFADSLVIDGLITSQIDTAPKPVDVASIATNNAAFGVIACHDGSIIKFAPSDNRYLGYNMADLEAVDKAVNRIIASKRLRGAQESEYLSTIEAEAGVTIERFVVC